LADSVLDAAPYSLPGKDLKKAPYTQNNLTATVGGPLVIPHIVKSTSTSYTVSYTGSRNSTPNDWFSNVPIAAYRNGDFRQALTGRNLCPSDNPNCDPLGRPIMEGTIYDPSTTRLAPNGLLVRDPFPDNIVPS